MVKKVTNGKLKSFMVLHGITQEALAERLEKSRQAINNKIENENFSQKEIYKIIELFSDVDETVTFDKLF